MREFFGVVGFLVLVGAAGTDQLQAAGFQREMYSFGKLVVFGVAGLAIMLATRLFPEGR